MPRLEASENVAQRILRAVRRVEQMPHRKERKRRRVIPPAPGTPDKTLYLPLEDLDNYVLPQDLNGTGYGFEWTPHATNLSNIDTSVELPIIDYYGSIGLPGQKLVCRHNAVLEAYTPIPYGQNAWQLARTYKTISAGDIPTGNDIFLLAGASFDEIVEVSDFVNDNVRFDHCHSNVDIVASPSEPADIILMLMNVDGGAELRIMGRACNP